jgi:hypothetical protein
MRSKGIAMKKLLSMIALVSMLGFNSLGFAEEDAIPAESSVTEVEMVVEEAVETVAADAVTPPG